MTHTPSRLLVNTARIILMMFALGLLSPAVQACALFQSQVVMSSMVGDNPCSTSDKNTKLNVPCTVGVNNNLEDCVVQSQKAVSTAHISSAPTFPYFPIEQTAWLPHSNSIALAELPTPTPSPRPLPVPLSILHCSFQI